MAATTTASRSLLRTTRRLFSTNAALKNNHQNTHEFLETNSFVGSWEKPKNPKEAEAKLARLRREYAKQVKELRKEYLVEVVAMRIEKQRKEEARKEAIRVANEERKKLKAEAAKARAEERKVEQEEFQKLLVKDFNQFGGGMEEMLFVLPFYDGCAGVLGCVSVVACSEYWQDNWKLGMDTDDRRGGLQQSVPEFFGVHLCIGVFVSACALMKERAEKLENWRMKEKIQQEKKKKKYERIHKQSSMWVEEGDLEKMIMEAVVDCIRL
ncbi:unnamed protein product [Dovyalis caffra]|uniref:Uncharacterized protein n=1 Tax=Dovyalis caffra TaxID=77055 RepID=A0AAV1R522_9ROSI|nr:unnamed protein product [Dovyalis caffra]